MSATYEALPKSDEPWLEVGGKKFRSRLIVGIEQYDSVTVVRDILAATGADVFITTIDPESRRSSLLLSDLDEVIALDDFVWVGTTSFSRTKQSAIDTARMLRGSLGITILKLDVRGADNTPDNRATIEAAHELRAEGMELLPFILPDLDTARELEDAGCAALRVMASPVASGRGILDPDLMGTIIEQCSIPVVVEGGLGSAKHVALAMELGAAATLINTALVRARDPLRMAVAMRHAATAGRLAYESGPMEATLVA